MENHSKVITPIKLFHTPGVSKSVAKRFINLFANAVREKGRPIYYYGSEIDERYEKLKKGKRFTEAESFKTFDDIVSLIAATRCVTKDEVFQELFKKDETRWG